MSADELDRIDAMLAAPDAGLPRVADFRLAFPGLSLTLCDASDLDGETPFKRYAGINLYLVDGTSHCWHLTQDPARATGVVMTSNGAGA